MEYNIADFTETLRGMMYTLFPYESDERKLAKHPNNPFHIRDIAFMWLPTSSSSSGETITFDIGSDYAEEYYPYYHILNDAPTIRKRGRGTKKSKGTQAKIVDLSKRDYGRVNFNGKTFTKEYQRNIRGERRKVVDKSTRYIYMGGQKIQINRNSNAYQNIHYNYISQILDVITPELANQFNMQLKRKIDTGLEEEYNEQYKQDSQNLAVGNWDLGILDIMESFEE